MKMTKNNVLKETGIKNCTCYFNDIISINDVDLNNILLDQKSYENILTCDVAYKLEGYIKKCDIIKYLALFHSDEQYGRIFDRIRYLITLKRNISDVYSHKYTKIKISADDDLPLEKTSV